MEEFYFGTGGLVKAYSEAAIGSLKISETKEIKIGILMKVTMDYSNLEPFKYFCRKNEIIIQKEEFFDNVVLYIKLTYEKEKMILENKLENSFIISKAEKIQEIYI